MIRENRVDIAAQIDQKSTWKRGSYGLRDRLEETEESAEERQVRDHPHYELAVRTAALSSGSNL